MFNNKMRNLIFVVLFFLIAIFVGGNIVGYAFGGLITFFSFILLLESVTWLRSLCYHLNAMVEIIMFAFGIYAKLHFGVTIAMSLMIAGILYSLIYRGYLVDTYKKQ